MLPLYMILSRYDFLQFPTNFQLFIKIWVHIFLYRSHNVRASLPHIREDKFATYIIHCKFDTYAIQAFLASKKQTFAPQLHTLGTECGHYANTALARILLVCKFGTESIWHIPKKGGTHTDHGKFGTHPWHNSHFTLQPKNKLGNDPNDWVDARKSFV